MPSTRITYSWPPRTWTWIWPSIFGFRLCSRSAF